MGLIEHRHDVLLAFAGLYYTMEDQRRFVGSANLGDMARVTIRFSPSALNSWDEILTYAEPRGLLPALFKQALKENPGSDDLNALYPLVIQNRPGEWKIDRQAGFDWRGPPGVVEKILGKRSTLADVAYLVRGVHRARSVAKVITPTGSGTGFLIDGDLLITNHHVLPSDEVARSSVALFGFERVATGLGDGQSWALRDAEPDRCALDPDSYFKTSEAIDTTIVHVKRNPVERWGTLPISPLSDPAGLREQLVNIIGHPGGAPKQASMVAGGVAYVGEGRVQYLTDTLPGSSGSPVFDEQWRVVALHHAGGVGVMEPGSTGGVQFLRNQGILINEVCALVGT